MNTKTPKAKINCCSFLTPNILEALNEVFNVAYGESSTLNELYFSMRDNLAYFDSDISLLEPVYGPFRDGDIPHSLASISKAKELLDYNPQFSLKSGLKETLNWYWENVVPAK